MSVRTRFPADFNPAIISPAIYIMLLVCINAPKPGEQNIKRSRTNLELGSKDAPLISDSVDATWISLSPFPEGSVVSITIIRNEESFQARAKVVYSLIGMGMGLAFLAAHPDQVKLFQRWILELNGHRPSVSGATEPEVSKANSTVESAKNEQQYVLSELIIALMRKGVLDKADGNAMLRKLNR